MEHIDSNSFWQFVIGESGESKNAEIKKHLNSCEDCMREFKLLNTIETSLHEVEEDVVSYGFSDIVIRKIENEITLEQKNTILAKLFPYIILSGSVLAFLATITIGLRLDTDLFHVEKALNNQVGILILTACGLLWGLYFIDKICKKIFVSVNLS